MIRSLIATIMLSFASTQGASIKKDAPLYKEATRTTPTAENPTYESTWDFPFVQKINGTWTHNYNDFNSWEVAGENKYNDYYFNQKNYNYTKNSAWTIYASMYTQNHIMAYRYEASGNIYGSLKIPFGYRANNENYTVFDEQSNNNLFIYKLEPHSTALTSSFNLNTILTSEIDTFSYNAQTPHNIFDIILKYRINIFTTNDDYVETYSNASITENSNFKSWYLDISYNVQDKTQETIYRNIKLGDIDSNNNITNENLQSITLTTNLQNLGIIGGVTNYVVILIERGFEIYDPTSQHIINTNPESLQIKDRWGETEGTRYNYYWIHNTQNTLSGTYLLNTNIEVVDIGGLMFQILGMPFQFYSSAFNITWFAGTPYSINISGIIITILASLIMIFIIRLILKVFT